MRVEANGKSISSQWHRRELARVLPRSKPVDQLGCGFNYITMSAQRIDVQNLIYIDSAVAALRCARVKKNAFGCGIFFTYSFLRSTISHIFGQFNGYCSGDVLLQTLVHFGYP